MKWKQMTGILSNVSVPTSEDICQSALVAALTLMFMNKMILSKDLLSLLTSFLPSPEGDLSPLLPDVPEGITHAFHIFIHFIHFYPTNL